MMATLAENSRFFGHAEALRRAVLSLSSADFLVIRVVAADEIFLEIDRPMHGDDVKNFQRDGKTFGSCDRFGCKIFWQISNGSE